MIKYLTILIPFVFLYINSYSQTEEWIVPKEKKEVVSTFNFTDENIKSGESLYQKNCLSCHGNPTKGNFAPLQPSPGDPASEKFQNQSDGSMFYKITEGRVLMPQFKNILSEKERWEVVAFIRSFNKNYVQPALAKIDEFKGDAVNIEIIFDKENRQLIAKAIGTVKEKIEPVKKAEMVLFAKRYFGNMQIDESKRTNEEGMAFFRLPEELPGNDSGYVEFIVRLNESSFGDIQKTALIHAGLPKNMEKLTDQRAMWNITRKAPVWLLISYFGGVLFVWSFIVYILLQLYKLRKIGSEVTNNE
ncbi:MAG: hypothetical protein A2W99_11995 [Bacteroidetes bacterium GWF2_33_16]|nr:MAG: hypothetical protein A2X00_02280 [Bacteroidetes bacterium GWE2_32_14]OFY06420.1 MAG: hypothetical protein A2W99_11995 [Bacteroidetes bacterium GWF2_33_16]